MFMRAIGENTCTQHYTTSARDIVAAREALKQAEDNRLAAVKSQWIASLQEESTAPLPTSELAAKSLGTNFCSKCAGPLRIALSGKCLRCGFKNSCQPAEITKYSLRRRVRKLLRKYDADRMFAIIDRDGNGSVDAEELQLSLGEMGCPLSDVDIKYLLSFLDQDGDGEISLSEFKMFLMEGEDAPRAVLEMSSKSRNPRDKTLQPGARARRKCPPADAEQRKLKPRRERKKERGRNTKSLLFPSLTRRKHRSKGAHRSAERRYQTEG
jgi:hypothetical protein